jgi:hypothetical protein
MIIIIYIRNWIFIRPRSDRKQLNIYFHLPVAMEISVIKTTDDGMLDFYEEDSISM